MNVFLLSSLALLALALACLLWPLWRRRAAMQSAASESPALRILREQRAEAEAEHASGRIDDAALAQIMSELEQRALSESTAPESANQSGPAYGWAIALALALPLASISLYLVLGTPAGLDPAQTAAQEQITPQQIEEMVARLAAKVEADPENTEGAQMLARSYMVLGRHADAAKVLERLSVRLPTDAQVLADWADALAASSDQKLAGEPEKLIQRALKLDPENVKALALSGTLAYERQQYTVAAITWEKILPRAEAESEFGKSIRAMVGEARQRAGMPPLAVAPESAKPAGADSAGPAATPVSSAAGSAAAPAGDIVLKLRLSLAPALKAQAAPGDPVFVFLRPAAGGPPLAGMRLTVADLPVELDLAQATRMNPAPMPERVILGARVSKSGQPMAQSGDLQALSEAVSPRAGSLQLEINTRLP